MQCVLSLIYAVAVQELAALGAKVRSHPLTAFAMLTFMCQQSL